MSRKPATPPPALEKPAQPGKVRAVVLAVLVHAAFFGLIVFGVTWQSKPTAPLQAEVWDKLPPTKSTEPTKPPPPPPKPQPKPEPKPEPPKPEPPKPPEVKPQPPKPDPAIAEKAEREKRERAKRERLEKEEKKKREEEELRKKREREEVAKKKREDEEKRKQEEAARKEAERVAAEARDRQQKEFDGFVNGIRAKIRGRANVPDTVRGNPEVTVRIRVLPGGEVLDISVVKRSGNPAYDTAIERAIRSASPLPVPPASHPLFPQFRELNLEIRHER